MAFLSEEPKQYINVKVPKDLIDEIEKVVREKKLGYRSRAEFVIEACRERLLKIKDYSKSR